MVKPDLLVAGGGIAGMAGAARAAARGLRVLVVEKGDRTGGSGALSPGILWTAPDVHAYAQVCPRGDRALGRVLVEGFDATVEHVREAGVYVSEPWHGHQGFGLAVQIDVHGLLARWEEEVLGAGGEIRLGSAVEELLLDLEGSVCGARVDGEEIESDAVLLATGGFQGDPVAVREHLGPGADLMPRVSNPHSTGDGLRMGRTVGAALAGPMDSFYGHLVPSPLADCEAPELHGLTQEHSRHCVLVNRHGRRFTCEPWGDEVSNQAAARQPGMRATLICDERVHREHVGYRFERARAAGARLVRAETLAGLTDFAERELLESRLEEPPFWALEVQPSLTSTHGGLRTDAEGRVRDAYGRPIPGLLAAGADVGGIHDTGHVGGLAVAVVFGPRAADAAAERSPAHVRS